MKFSFIRPQFRIHTVASSRVSRRRGATIVEMALLLPILLALIFGVIEFGWLMRNQLLAANGTREGARLAGLGKSPTQIVSRVKTTAAPLAIEAPTGSVLLRWSNNDGADNYPYAVGEYEGKNTVPSGKMIKVQVISKHRTLTGFFPFLKDREINAYVVMRRE